MNNEINVRSMYSQEVIEGVLRLALNRNPEWFNAAALHLAEYGNLTHFGNWFLPGSPLTVRIRVPKKDALAIDYAITNGILYVVNETESSSRRDVNEFRVISVQIGGVRNYDGSRSGEIYLVEYDKWVSYAPYYKKELQLTETCPVNAWIGTHDDCYTAIHHAAEIVDAVREAASTPAGEMIYLGKPFPQTT